ncbi:MAG: hypothetical protein ACI8ZB_003184 [Desulforhopalus sp.]|jgi:hypothetical protein
MKLSRLFKTKTSETQAPSTITRTESLACIPERSSAVTWDEQENGEITIEYPLPLKPFFISLAKKFNKTEEPKLTKKLQLDSIGSKVWMLIDGSTDVKSIIKAIVPGTGLSLQEAEISVTTFLRELGRRGLILIK